MVTQAMAIYKSLAAPPTVSVVTMPPPSAGSAVAPRGPHFPPSSPVSPVGPGTSVQDVGGSSPLCWTPQDDRAPAHDEKIGSRILRFKSKRDFLMLGYCLILADRKAVSPRCNTHTIICLMLDAGIAG
ncbi:hypothetical protein Vretimale_3296, partial [Volvox reticuliferus]